VGWSPAYSPGPGNPRLWQVADIAKQWDRNIGGGQLSPGAFKSFSHRGYEYEYGALGD
jgi:hypothetical protein